MLEIEAAQIDVVAEPFAVLVVHEEARRRGEHLARLLPRRGFQSSRLFVISIPRGDAPADAAHFDLEVVLVLLARR